MAVMPLAERLAQYQQLYQGGNWDRNLSGDPLAYKVFYDTVGRAPTEGEFRKYAAAATGKNVDLAGMIAGDQSILEQGQREQDAIRQLAQEQETRNATRRTQLADLLTKRADTLFSEQMPSIAEDANAKGIYTGTGFSDALAREKRSLAGDVSNTLAMQGLSDIDSTNSLEQNALNRRLGLEESGLSRNFSLQDFARQATMAQQLGAVSEPASGKGGGSGAIMGGASGAAAGAPFGPWGAGIGGIGGALLGGLSKRKGGGK